MKEEHINKLKYNDRIEYKLNELKNNNIQTAFLFLTTIGVIIGMGFEVIGFIANSISAKMLSIFVMIISLISVFISMAEDFIKEKELNRKYFKIIAK